MSDSLSLFIDYINDNIIFGSEIKREKLENLFNQFAIKNDEKSTVYDELKSLDIIIVESQDSYKNKLKRLFSMFDENKELLESDLLKWFEEEVVNAEVKVTIRTLLKDMDYIIINDINKKVINKELELLEIEDSDELDDLLDNDEFKENLKDLKDIVDKRHNIMYLSDYEKYKEDYAKKSELLDNIAFANKKLVYKIVLKYKGLSTPSFNEDDMFQAGMQGLLKAVERFDVEKGFQFSTYATHWIRQNISRSIADFSTTIRVPVHMRDKINKLINIENEFFNTNSRTATKRELAVKMECEVDEIETMKKVKTISNLASLETTIGENEDSLLIDFIPDEKSISTENQVADLFLKQEIDNLFNNKLTEREAKVLLMRFGFENGQIYTLEEIGQEIGVTRERIRQIESKALKKLKFIKIKERLGEYYYG
ncbi:sigma-70 family RNA polymerase sigma factor [Staphylococcus xylosus]|uniref:Sigma-70 family RNA polymerase sigma factor n=1 Tax=Staphylococcus xylosus TaxID=1288 RepID=A0AAQ0LYE0_STAXY|nr:sigma-70 family RNA polymerase sigma factor [Staphylococcus xylosus]RIM66595.1 sigma-70 family RNA polymerase sigma factor [Staphylococcus xylosus]RIM92440.1 sigma-70 family RNA polymerase sigma factor [Staphylococcus xylosus]